MPVSIQCATRPVNASAGCWFIFALLRGCQQDTFTGEFVVGVVEVDAGTMPCTGKDYSSVSIPLMRVAWE